MLVVILPDDHGKCSRNGFDPTKTSAGERPEGLCQEVSWRYGKKDFKPMAG